MTSWFRALLTVSALALALGGCGVRGSLETPAEAKADATAEAQSGQGKPEGAAPKPHKGFILDGLLR
ncbi:MAG: hypothetical protein JNN24_12080 [Hyphomicrobium zavarzinii]|uniref:LPS translocon maturation chaperone LptM n=1 Tax=Hyphomicrobium TaxID=81 RepID=UPI0003A5D8F3|nr:MULTISPECIES: lipoprotein [Hyphomicrobium]MBL8846499.1 hypothetical protein [Hyphomicrobium zavarzinii]WBT38681.1 lipoprotein [Hyphomicrobium sp. DMF-1]HML44831.1 lipoprotein [Hyphomicrobium zavarzinii]